MKKTLPYKFWIKLVTDPENNYIEAL